MKESTGGMSPIEELKGKLRSKYIDLFIISLGVIFTFSLTFTIDFLFLHVGTFTLSNLGFSVVAYTIKEIIDIKKNIKREKEYCQSYEKQQSIEIHKNSIKKLQPAKYTEEEIKEIHKRGNLTQEEAVREWESLDLCAPGNNIGSANHRCYQFSHDCHDCLVNYSQELVEHSSILGSLKLTNSIYSFREEENTDKQIHHTKSLKRN